MAKKKVDKQEEIDVNSVPELSAELAKKYGAGTFISADAILANPRMIIPVSPAFDIGLTGGIPEGSWVVFTGPEKCGKTTTAMHFAANCQKEEYGNRIVFYLDVESRLKEMNIKGIPHLKRDRFHVVKSTPEKKYSAEEFFEIAEKLIKDYPGCVIIIDSFSALSTATELAGKMTDQQRADAQKLTSKFIHKTCQDVSANKCFIIGMTHNMSNVGARPGQKTTVEKSASSLKYQGDVKVSCSYKEEIKQGEKIIGHVGHWKVIFSALGSPGSSIESIIKFGKGIDEVAELLKLAVEVDLVEKPDGTSWYTFKRDGEAIKKQGQKANEYLEANPEYLEELKKELMERLS